MKHYVYEFIVSGRFDFPVDMLRYDRCWPKSETRDSSLIAASWTRRRDVAEGHEITLIGLNHPTEARWQSFGWKVKTNSVSKREL